jgi:hypothetical protein
LTLSTGGINLISALATEEQVKDIGQVAKRRPGDGGGWWWNRSPRPSAVRRLTKAWGVLAIVGLLTALAAACGGGGEPEGEGSPTPPPTGEDAALAPCRALQALKSYRYSLDLTLESPESAETPAEPQPTPTIALTPRYTTAVRFDYAIDASFVAPDRIEAVITAGSGDAFSMISIGDQVWVELAGRWTTPSEQTGIPYLPLDICEGVLFDLDLSQVEPQEEKLNDVKSLHYSLPQASAPQAMAKIFGVSSDMAILIKTLDVELWLAENDKWPVHLDIDGSGFYTDGRELRVHVSIDVRDANSGDIQVEPPV